MASRPESMDCECYGTSFPSTRYMSQTTRIHHCSKSWGFYGSIQQELFRHFYGPEVANIITNNLLEDAGNFFFHCISKSAEMCKYVHTKMDEIERDVKDMDMFKEYVHTPLSLDTNIEGKIIKYVKEKTSDSVYMKYSEEYKSVRMYSKNRAKLQHEKEELERKLKEEVEAVQEKEGKASRQSKTAYDEHFPPLEGQDHLNSTKNMRQTQTPSGAWEGSNIPKRGLSRSFTSTFNKASNFIDPFIGRTPVFSTPKGIKVYVKLHSITELRVDVIINAANEMLSHGAGVAKAIADAGGFDLINDCNRIIRQKVKVDVTDNIATSAGHLPCLQVIHAVGPRWNDYQNKEDCLKHLSDTVEEALKTASKDGFKTVALPAISSGIFGVPKSLCAKMYIRGIMKFSKIPKAKSVEKIVLVDLTTEILEEVVAAYNMWSSNPDSIKPSVVLKHVNRGGHTPLRCAQSVLVYPHDNVSRQGSHGNRDATHFTPKQTKPWAQMPTQKIPKQHEVVHCFEIEDGFLQVKVYTGSIVKVKDMSGLVCSADISISGMGPLNEAIAKEGGPRYVSAFRDMQKRFKRSKTVGDIVSCPGGDLGTKYVVHVIMNQLSSTLQYELQEHKKHILNTFLRADNWSMKKIALPLIGGGFVEKDEKDLSKLCKVFYEAVTEYCQQLGSSRSLREIHFINRNPGITKAIVKCFQEHSSLPSHTVNRQTLDPSKSDYDRYDHSTTHNQGARPKSGRQHGFGHYNSSDSDHQGARPKSGRQSTKNRDSNDSSKHSDFDHDTTTQSWNKRNTSQRSKSLYVPKHKGEFSGGGSDHQTRPRSGNHDDRQKQRTDFTNTICIGGSGVGKLKQTNRYGITDDLLEDDFETEASILSQMNSRSSATAKATNSCDSCSNQIVGEAEELPCGHVFCKLPCFIPMEANRDCFVCLKDSKNVFSNSQHGSSIDEQEKTEEKTCVICMDTVKKGKKLECGHEFCDDCIMMSFKHKPVCPTCGAIFGELEGDQPDGGEMTVKKDKHRALPGYGGYGTFEIFYSFRDGIQQENHPEPGKPYKGTERRAFLPMNAEGKKVLKLLRVAFDRKLTFTIGSSRTTGEENVVTWNDIHHKTKRDTGAARFGYPDPTYLTRVQDELAAKGITEDCL